MIGVTSWIRGDVLGGVRFRRAPRPVAYGATKKGGSAARGVSLGRHVDRLFKEWCTTRKIGKGPSDAVRRVRYVVATLGSLRLQPTAANVFVTSRGIKTHMDATAVDASGRTVVIELKSTQATAAAHRVDRDVPCLNQPSTRFGPNTEALHHKLQTAFGVHAHNASYGVVLVACSDMAVAHTIPRSAVDPKTFSVTRGRSMPVVLFDWPHAAEAALPGKAWGRSDCGQLGLMVGGGSAVALRSRPARENKTEVEAAKRLLARHPEPRFLVFPSTGRWRRQCVR